LLFLNSFTIRFFFYFTLVFFGQLTFFNHLNNAVQIRTRRWICFGNHSPLRNQILKKKKCGIWIQILKNKKKTKEMIKNLDSNKKFSKHVSNNKEINCICYAWQICQKNDMERSRNVQLIERKLFHQDITTKDPVDCWTKNLHWFVEFEINSRHTNKHKIRLKNLDTTICWIHQQRIFFAFFWFFFLFCVAFLLIFWGDSLVQDFIRIISWIQASPFRSIFLRFSHYRWNHWKRMLLSWKLYINGPYFLRRVLFSFFKFFWFSMIGFAKMSKENFFLQLCVSAAEGNCLRVFPLFQQLWFFFRFLSEFASMMALKFHNLCTQMGWKTSWKQVWEDLVGSENFWIPQQQQNFFFFCFLE